jgi:hypothetical protein
MTDDRLKARLAELRREYATGEARLRDLTRQEVALRETLLRISGAIQVLEELEAADGPGLPTPTSPAPAGADDRPEPRIMTVG